MLGTGVGMLRESSLSVFSSISSRIGIEYNTLNVELKLEVYDYDDNDDDDDDDDDGIGVKYFMVFSFIEFANTGMNCPFASSWRV